MSLGFLRRDAARFSKFGKGRGKKAGWKKPKGRDNKMREKRSGYASIVSIGFGTSKPEVEIIKISNVKDLEKITKGKVGLIASVGKKKKIEIARKAKEMKIKLKNLNPEKYLDKNSEEKKDSKENKVKENKK